MRGLVPEPLEVDTFDGWAWVGLVPFTMPRVRHRFGPVPTMRRFHECNVRTYVRCGDERGVWFHSLDATSRLAVAGARMRWRLNYRMAEISIKQHNDCVAYRVRRLDHTRRMHLDQPGVEHAVDDPRLDCAWTIGEALPRAQPGELEHFLTERYGLFALDRHGGVRIGRIHHDPWPLRQATLDRLDDASLATAAGVPAEVISDVAPHVMAADTIEVDAWALEAVSRAR